MFHLCYLFLLLSPVKSNGENITTFPAILIFGDSTVDTGNNNYLTTAVKANHYPYGKDFPTHFPTGRFSNGKLSVDFLASMLGVKESIPPFVYPGLSTYELVTGVSFASAGTGYDTLTTAMTRVLPMSKQVEYFKSYSERLKKIVGEKEARRIINRALVAVSAGTNDFIFNFYDVPTRRAEFNIYNYQEFILERLHDFVKGCCGTGLLEAGPICTPLTPLCQNSSEYLFFDSIHPSEKAYHYVTECLMKEINDRL
ncbi:putative triacylglycerol lipase [Helianthus anomalus]